MKMRFTILAGLMIAGLAGAQQMDYCIGRNPDRHLIPQVVTFKELQSDSLKVGGIPVNSIGTNVALQVAAITATGTVTLTKQTCTAYGAAAITNSAGVTIAVVTNTTATVAISVLNGGVVVTNVTLQASSP